MEEEIKTNEPKEKELPLKEEKFDPRKATYAVICNPWIDTGIDGIKFDYIDGLRIQTPETVPTDKYRVIIENDETGTTLSNQTLPPGNILSTNKKFFTRIGFKIYDNAELEAYHKELYDYQNQNAVEPKPIFEHTFDMTDKCIMIQMPVHTIGDTLAWFPYIDVFYKKHPEIRKVIAVLAPEFIDIIAKQYPHIEFMTKEDIINGKLTEAPYACYYLGLFFNGDLDHQPIDFKKVGLHTTAGNILGCNDYVEHKPLLDLSAERTIKERYVCIAAKSSSQAKHWNNPFGWNEVVKFLKESGYRVLCIDRDPVTYNKPYNNPMPFGAEDFTGRKKLQERIDLLVHADFFIGLGSGLSWLAWACNIPVVMISGFSLPFSEFYTPYRVINYNVCNGCWSDPRYNFEHNNVLWCPVMSKEHPERMFECTYSIHPKQVIDTIKTIPQYQEMIANK